MDKPEFLVCVVYKTVERYDYRNPELLHIFDMSFQVRDAFFKGLDVLRLKLILRRSAVKLERADSCDYHYCMGVEARIAGDDVHELLSSEV